MSDLTHVDVDGRANMVDVGDKPTVRRRAVATGRIDLAPETVARIQANEMKKGDVLTVAQIAGIQAAKRCPEWIPLCHPLPLTKVDVRFVMDDEGVAATGEAACTGRTGVEMEALTAVSAALLTIYDMCKAVDKNMIIKDILLVEKTKEEA